jgi:TRAP-type mannitol/chloroaromatic compound transport system permease small subunit
MWSFLSKRVDRLSEWMGYISSWLVVILIGELVYDTLVRYLFNAPSGWSYDITYMLYGAAFMGGGAWTLLRDEHVRIDLIYGKISPKAKAIVDAIGYVVFFFPSMGVLLYFSTKSAVHSWKMFEGSGETVWNPPIYPLKTVLVITILMLSLQGIVQFVRCITVLREGGKYLDHQP